MTFLFFFYFVGLIITVCQDIYRREIDDWLNLFLFFSGVLFLISSRTIYNSTSLVLFGFFIFFTALLSFLFYYARFFSGGDSKLFFALSPLVFVPFFELSLFYLGLFVISLFLCGSIYSLIYSGILFFKDFSKTRKRFIVEIRKKQSLYFIFISFVFLILSFFNKIFILLSFIIFLFIILLCLAKTLEDISMKKLVLTKNLREGDWLFSDVKVGKRLFKKSWDGLTLSEIKYLKKYNKKVFIKDGIPYAPSFFFALILFVFRDYLLGIIFS